MAVFIPENETPPLYKDRYEMYFRQSFYIDNNYYWVYSNWKIIDTNKKRELFEKWLKRVNTKGDPDPKPIPEKEQ